MRAARRLPQKALLLDEKVPCYVMMHCGGVALHALPAAGVADRRAGLCRTRYQLRKYRRPQLQNGPCSQQEQQRGRVAVWPMVVPSFALVLLDR